VALAFIDHPWSSASTISSEGQRLTTDFAYIRWLGDRKGIEKGRGTESSHIDRTRDMAAGSQIRQIIDDGTAVYGYFNNHYAATPLANRTVPGTVGASGQT